MIGKAVLNGIDSIRRILEIFRRKKIHADVVNGYNGLMIENFQTAAKFNTCVEVTAGSSCFITSLPLISLLPRFSQK
ncbi:structural maintenance of chromosomes protein 3-like [Saccoglossus kowalevskii]